MNIFKVQRTKSNDSNKSKKKKRILLILIIILLLLTIAGIIFIYIKLNDKNRNPNKINDYEISEIIKKNYIDGIKDINDDGEGAFSLFQYNVNTQ